MMEDKTKPLKKKFFEVKNLNSVLFDGKVPPLEKNAFWGKSKNTSDVIAGKQLKNGAKSRK